MTIPFAGPLCALIVLAASAKMSRFEQGQRAFAEGDYAAALKLLDQAATEGADLEKVQLLRAQCFAAQQDFVRAEEAFALALEANPEASLDPTRVDPSVVKVLDGLRARTRGPLLVRSTPEGAAITLDGKSTGAEVATKIGRHKLEAKWPDGTVASLEVLVHAKRETYVVLVQGPPAAAAAEPVEPNQKPGLGIKPFADVRALMETGGGVYGAMEIGGGVELKFFRAGAHLRLVPSFGFTARAALVVPLVKLLSAFVEAEVPMIFSGQVAIGLGAAAGVEWHPLKFLGFWAALGGRHFFQLSDPPLFLNNDRFTLMGGVRLRLP